MTQRREIKNNTKEITLTSAVTVLDFNDVIKILLHFFPDTLNLNLFMVYRNTQITPPTIQRLTIG
jgi:hypothetical protein